MKRLSVIFIVSLFFALVLAMLLFFGSYFFTHTLLRNDLVVDDITSHKVTLGTPLSLDLQGRGFDDQTVVSMSVDVGHRDAIVGTFPVPGVYNESLQFGDTLYLCSNKGGIAVLDIKDRTHPRLVDEYLSDHTIIDIHRHENTLYLSCGKLGVSIMTISSGGRLEHVADITLTSMVWKTYLVDHYLYMAAGSAGLVVYDVEQPKQAKFITKIAAHFASNFAVRIPYLYLDAGQNRISIFSIDHPKAPVVAGSLLFNDKLHDLAIYQQGLYLATETGVSLFDLDSPYRPQLNRQWTDFGSAEKLFPGKNHMYVSDSFSGFRIIDPSNEYLPEFINLSINPRTVIEDDAYLYVAGSDQGLLIVEKELLSLKSSVETLNTAGSAHDLWIHDHWLYVADAAGGIVLKNLVEENAPFIGVSKRHSESFAFKGHYLFVAQGRKGVEVFDVSFPGQPKKVTEWPDLQGWRLAVGTHHVVVTKGISGLDFVNISDIYHPRIVDSITGIHPLDVTIVGDTLYVVSKNDGLLIYRIMEGERLKRISQLTTPFPMNHFDLNIAIQVSDGIAYIANGRAGLLIVDVSDPVNPAILSSTSIPGVCKELKVLSDLVYTVSQHGGVSIVDVKDPTCPILLNTFVIYGLSRGIEIVDSSIYVAHNAMGVTVIPRPTVAETLDVVSGKELRVKFPSPQGEGYYTLRVSKPHESVTIRQRILYKH